MTADASNVTMSMASKNMSIWTSNNFVVAASNNVSLTSASNVLLGALVGDFKAYAGGSNTYLTLDHTTRNVNVFASNDVVVSGSNSVYVTAQQYIYGVANSNIDFTAKSNILLSASNSVSTIAIKDFIVSANSNVAVNAKTGSLDVYAHNSNMFLTMNSLTDTVSLYGLSNVSLAASNDVLIAGDNNVNVAANTGDMGLYANSNLTLAADGSNMSLTMDKTTDQISMFSLSNIDFTASNLINLQSFSNVSISSSNIDLVSQRDISIVGSNDIVISASNSITLACAILNTQVQGDQSFTAQSNIDFFIQAASNGVTNPIFRVSGDQILVNGDIVITGNINTSNVFNTTVIQESLKINDRMIVLANSGSNFNPSDGPFDSPDTNDGAGVRVDGVPLGFDSNITTAYDKSLIWNFGNGNGISDLGTAPGMSNECFWELKGGSFRMTHQKVISAGGSNIVRDISFGLRVNEFDELEMVKKFWYAASNAYIFRRVARFGRIQE